MVEILLCFLHRIYNSVVHILPSLLPYINYYNYGRISIVFYTFFHGLFLETDIFRCQVFCFRDTHSNRSLINASLVLQIRNSSPKNSFEIVKTNDTMIWIIPQKRLFLINDYKSTDLTLSLDEWKINIRMIFEPFRDINKRAFNVQRPKVRS